MRIALFFLLTISSFSSKGNPESIFQLKIDLGKDWLVFENNSYKPFENREEDPSTIYFWLNSDKYKNDYLRITSSASYHIFINGKLLTLKSSEINIDSLADYFAASNLLIAVHFEEEDWENLKTEIVTKIYSSQTSLQSDNEKPSTFFRDFVVVAMLSLLIMLIVVLRLNQKLAADYFSVTKIFSLRESDDAQIYTRISNSANILFYGFCSLILGFYLIVVFHFSSEEYALTNYFSTTNFLSTILKWIGASFIIFTIFFLKIILVYSLSTLFGSRTMAGIHFFNWVRLLLMVFGSITIILFFYFILRGQNPGVHIALLKLILWCFFGWIILIFLKLNGRTGYSMFHLFSYICATEIIPLLIIISVLYN